MFSSSSLETTSGYSLGDNPRVFTDGAGGMELADDCSFLVVYSSKLFPKEGYCDRGSSLTFSIGEKV